MELDITEIKSGGVSFVVKVVPGSSKTSIEGVLGGMLKVKIATVAEKGKANKELIGFLAKLLDVRKKDIEITSGTTNPVKTLVVNKLETKKLKSIINF